MKHKFTAVLCAGMMSTASCLIFVGCAEKSETCEHVYEDSYELATCTEMGYTLHSCSKCDYKYADEFVMPYDHAYEHCVRFAMPVEAAPAEVSARAKNANGASDALIEVEGLPTSTPIGDPFCEIDKDTRAVLDEYMSKYLNEHVGGSSQSAETIAFDRAECAFCGSGGERAYRLSVPRSSGSGASDPTFAFGNAGVTFQMDLVDGGGSGAFGDEHHGPTWAYVRDNMSHENKSTVWVNTEYRMNDGVLGYDKVANTPDKILRGANPVQLCISDMIEEIAPNAFISCTNLQRVEIPHGIKKIGANAFGASKLGYTVLPTSLKYIGKNAFGDCNNMQMLFYAGTEAEWNQITFEDENDPIKSVSRYYYSMEPKYEGKYWYMINGKQYIW